MSVSARPPAPTPLNHAILTAPDIGSATPHAPDAMRQQLVTHFCALPYLLCALLHLRSSYERRNLRFDLGVEKVAGVRRVPGMGRNFSAGLTVKF